MNNFSKTEMVGDAQDVCPHLALKEDDGTVSSYPSQLNACYHVQPVNTPNLMHQQKFCLSKNFKECQIYQANAKVKMPKNLQLEGPSLWSDKKRVFGLIGILVIIVMIILGIIFKDFWLSEIANILGGKNAALPDATPSVIFQSPTSRFIKDATPTLSIAEMNPSETLTPELPTPTATFTNTKPPLALETPIGGSYKFIIHQVVEGESLPLYASWYQTSLEAIQAVNGGFEFPIQIGDLVIIPVDLFDVSDLPAFEPYQVEGDILVDELAIELNVSIDDLTLYNNIDRGNLLQRGDWIIVPRDQIQP